MFNTKKYCPKCQTLKHVGLAENFCSMCGDTLIIKKELPYIGESPTNGRYKITCIVTQEFSSEDSANESTRHSSFGEDGTFDDYETELLELTTTIKTHPYICGECQKKRPEWALVSSHTDGRCENCGTQSWIERKN